jgi:hypothetical protein
MNYLAGFQTRRLDNAWAARFRQFKISGFVWTSPRQIADEPVMIDEIEIRCEKSFGRVNPKGNPPVVGWRVKMESQG